MDMITEKQESIGKIQNRNVQILEKEDIKLVNQKDHDNLYKIIKTDRHHPSIENTEYYKMNSIISLIAFSSILKMFISSLKNSHSLSMGKLNLENIKWGFLLSFFMIGFSLSFYLIRKIKNLGYKLLFMVLFLIISMSTIYFKINGFVCRSFFFMAALVFSFKIYSFLLNIQSKDSHKDENKQENIDFSYFRSFIISPAIFFKPNYPKKSKRDFTKIFYLISKGAIYGSIMAFLFHNTTLSILSMFLKSEDKVHMIENFILLNIAVMILFNLFFIVIFKCFFIALNEISGLEILVYRDWWNARDSSEFWRYWNVPMHVFIKEHIFLPLIKRDFNLHFCRIFCLFFSGCFHELIIFLATRKLRGWFFLAMILQDPLLYVTYQVRKHMPRYANLFFLILFCVLGQTVGFILLFTDSILKTN